MEKIPIIDLKAQYETIRGEMRAAIDAVLAEQHFILGPAVEQFERAAAAYLGSRRAIGVASGSDALLLALMALGIGPGDAVVVPPFTFIATVSAVTRLGAMPIFSDVDGEDYLLDPERLKAALEKNRGRVKAVVPVHLFGRVARMKEIGALAAAHNAAVVEDAAQAFGARADSKSAGTIGTVGCFSFFPTKNLGGIGDGGLVATDDSELAEKVAVLRAHGESAKYEHRAIGINSRLDAIQAAVLGVKLRHVDRWCAARIARAAHYEKLFRAAGLLDGRVAIPAAAPDRAHAFNYFVIRAAARDGLKKFLAAEGIQTEIYYPLPLHLQPCFGYLNHRRGDFPNAEKAAAEVLALPIYPEIAPEQQERVVGTIAKFYRK